MIDGRSKNRSGWAMLRLQRIEGEGQRVLISEYPAGTFATFNPDTAPDDLNSKLRRFKGDSSHIVLPLSSCACFSNPLANELPPLLEADALYPEAPFAGMVSLAAFLWNLPPSAGRLDLRLRWETMERLFQRRTATCFGQSS
jgi:hypothetical protein